MGHVEDGGDRLFRHARLVEAFARSGPRRARAWWPHTTAPKSGLNAMAESGIPEASSDFDD
jgi:hypothetical protein